MSVSAEVVDVDGKIASCIALGLWVDGEVAGVVEIGWEPVEFGCQSDHMLKYLKFIFEILPIYVIINNTNKSNPTKQLKKYNNTKTQKNHHFLLFPPPKLLLSLT